MNSVQDQVRAYWDARPCGSTEVSGELGSVDFLVAHARMRYGREPMIEPFADFAGWAGRRILEVGVGMGADHLRFLKGRAEAVGIDLSPHSLKMTSLRAKAEGVRVSLVNADAERLPFPDNSFDMAYSWGVLGHVRGAHHATREIHRVLKPAGELRIMLYNRHSLNALQLYLYYGLLRGKPLAKVASLAEQHLESPGTKVYTPKEAKELLHEFSDVQVKPAVTAYDLRFGRRRFAPRWMLRLIPDRLGWFLLIRAHK